MTDNNGIVISDITANAAIWAPDEQAVISFKFKNGTGKKILNMRMDIILMVKDFTGGTSADTITLAQLVGEGYYMSAVNIANGKSKTYSTSFTIPTVAEQYFSENQNVRAVPIYIRYTATDSDGAYGSAFQIDALKVLNHRFSPQITAMQLIRAKNGVPDDEGENVLTTLKLGVSAGGLNYSNFLTARLYRAQGDNATTADPAIDLTGKVAQLLGGVTDDKDLIPDTYSKAYDWDFLLVFGDEYESFQGRFNLGMAFANMHLSEKKKGGVCFGGFSTSTDTKPKLESYFPAYFKSGINQLGEKWEQLTPLNGTTPADLGGGALRCRKVENKRIIEGSIKVKGKVDSNGDDVTVLLAELPDDYTPEKAVFSINACKGGRVARIVVGGKGETNAGYLCLSWIKNLSNGSSYTSESIWVQCSIEYWVEATEEDTPSTANMIDSNGAVVIDDDGKAFSVRETGDQIYQSDYTGEQIDAGILAAQNALPRSGGEMTGALTLNGAPTADNHAATKKYVDEEIGRIELIPGTTPHIGDNGNWYLGAVDTGVKAKGEDGYTPVKNKDYFDGENGKSAYAYAQEGGYTGTEEEFSEDLGKVGDQDEAITSWYDIPDKPFGNALSGSASIEADTLRWNGNTEGMFVDGDLVYVSENVPTFAQLNSGCKIWYKFYDWNEYEWTLAPEYYGGSGNVIALNRVKNDVISTYAFVVQAANVSAGDFYFERAGVYFYQTKSGYIKALTITGYAWSASEGIGPIPDKYIDEHVAWNNIDGNPFRATITGGAETNGDTLTWDGIIDSKTITVDVNQLMKWVYVSDNVPSARQLANGYKILMDATRYGYIVYEVTGTAIISEDEYGIRIGIPGDMDQIYIVKRPHEGSKVFTRAGVYFWTNAVNMHICSFKINNYVWEPTKEYAAEPSFRIPALSELIMIGADGNRYKLTINASGQLTTTAI